MTRKLHPYSGRERLLKLGAAFFGLGYFPLAPGTAGALGGAGLYLLLRWKGGVIPEKFSELTPGYLIFLAVFFLIGVYLSTRGEKIWRRPDPAKVVIDEAFSFLITMFCVGYSLPVLAAGFVLNRIFDVLKPFPLRSLEKLPRGWGIMMDDLGAGVYSNLALRLLLLLIIRG